MKWKYLLLFITLESILIILNIYLQYVNLFQIDVQNINIINYFILVERQKHLQNRFTYLF